MPSNPRRTIYAINGSAGAVVAIPVTVNGGHYTEISECPPDGGAFAGTAYAPQGLNATFPDDGFVLQYAYVPGDVIPFGDKDAGGRPGAGRGLGFAARVDNSNPGGPNVPATVLCKLISATATASQVEVREWV